MKRLQIITFDENGDQQPFLTKDITWLLKLKTMWKYKTTNISEIALAYITVDEYNATHEKKIDGWAYKVIEH